MKSSEQINDLAQALALAQGSMKSALRNSRNPHFNYSYADLSAVIEAAREPLSKNNLAVVQTLDGSDVNTTKVETVLMHKSGQWISSTIEVRPTQQTPQGMGSAITYARRYAYAAIIGMASEEDDDGNTASQGSEKSAQQTSHAPAKEPLITDHQMKKIFALGGELYSSSDRVKEVVKKVAGVEHMKDITIAQANKIIDGLQAKFNQKQAQTTENAEKGGQS